MASPLMQTAPQHNVLRRQGVVTVNVWCAVVGGGLVSTGWTGRTDTFPLPTLQTVLRVPLALVLKFNNTAKPLIDVRISTPFGNGASTVSGHSDSELFQVRGSNCVTGQLLLAGAVTRLVAWRRLVTCYSPATVHCRRTWPCSKWTES